MLQKDERGMKMKKGKWGLLAALLCMLFGAHSFAEVNMIIPQKPYDIVYVFDGKVDFGWLDLSVNAEAVIRDEAGKVMFEEEVLAGSMKWSCDAGSFEEGKEYRFELTEGNKKISYPFYVSFERAKGINARLIREEGLPARAAYLADRINTLLFELAQEDIVYATSISEYRFSTRKASTLIHPQLFIIDNPGMGSKGDLNTQKMELQLIMSMAYRVFGEIRESNKINQVQSGFPLEEELGREIRIVKDSFGEYYALDSVEFKCLLNKKVSDFSDILLFAIIDSKTGLLMEDAIYMLITIDLKGNWTYAGIDADQEVIEQYLHLYHNTSRTQLFAKAGFTTKEHGQPLQDESGSIGKVRIREGTPVHVRETGSTEGKRVGGAKGGMIYDCVGIAPSGWYGIRLEDGTIGYVSNKLAVWVQN